MLQISSLSTELSTVTLWIIVIHFVMKFVNDFLVWVALDW